MHRNHSGPRYDAHVPQLGPETVSLLNAVLGPSAVQKIYKHSAPHNAGAAVPSGLGAISLLPDEPSLPVRLDTLRKSIDCWRMRTRGLASLLALLFVAVAVAWVGAPVVAHDYSSRSAVLEASGAVASEFSELRADAPVMLRAHAAGAHDNAGHGSHDHGPGHDHQTCPDCSCCSCAGMSHVLPAHVRPGIVDNSAPRLFCAYDDAARHLGVRFSLLRPPRITA